MIMSSGNGASAHGVRQVAWFDCPGGGQVVVDGRVACIAHMKAPHGTTLVDVSDPKAPRQLSTLDVPTGTHSHKVRAVDRLMLVNREGHGGQPGHGRGRARDLGRLHAQPAARDHLLALGRARRASLHLRRPLRLHLAGDGRLPSATSS